MLKVGAEFAAVAHGNHDGLAGRGPFGGKAVEVGVHGRNQFLIGNSFGVVCDHDGTKRGNDVFDACNARCLNACGGAAHEGACFGRNGIGDNDIDGGISAHADLVRAHGCTPSSFA